MPQVDLRVGKILDLIRRIAGGDLQARLNSSDATDELDAITEGLNMLAEELDASTVSIARYREMVAELQSALAHVKTLSGLLPVCAWCKQVRSDEGYWTKLETYVTEHSAARFTHGICPECAEATNENEPQSAEVATADTQGAVDS